MSIETETAEDPTRRTFMIRAALAGAAAPAALAAGGAQARGAPDFEYEVQRSEAEWREMLTEDEYGILRDFRTEAKFTSPFAEEKGVGTYSCKGCDLDVYEGRYQIVLPIGWVFFYNSVPDSILLGIDTGNPYGGEPDMQVADENHLIEAHCRRCGSHMGHVVRILDKALHCINGTAMEFRPAEA